MHSFAPFLSFLVVLFALGCKLDLVFGHSTAPGVGHFRYDEVAHQRHAQVAASHVGDNSTLELRKRAGSATFTHFVPNVGACGGVNTESDFIVALNIPQWDAGAHCFQTITLTYKGKSTQAQIVDSCQNCGWNNLDLSTGLFTFFEDPQAGVIQGEWFFGTGEPAVKPSPTSTSIKSTTTSISSTKKATTLPSIASKVSSSTSHSAVASSTIGSSTIVSSTIGSSTIVSSTIVSSTIVSSTIVSSTVTSAAATAAATVEPGFLDQVNSLAFNLGEIIIKAQAAFARG